MKRIVGLAAFLSFIIPITAFCQDKSYYDVLNGKELTHGYDIGINTSGEQHGWLKGKGNELVMTYPDNQDWGAAFITVGHARHSQEERESRDYSTYDSLFISMKGAKGGEKVDIGIKDKTNPDNGQETKKTVTLSNVYSQYAFALKDFITADREHLYVVTEFVFGQNSPCKIFVNSVKFK
jgi:hypothetical protein